MKTKSMVFLATLLFALPSVAMAQVSVWEKLAPNMPKKPIMKLLPAQKAGIAAKLLHLTALPALGETIDLTVNNPYAPNGARLGFYMPTLVGPNAQGGFAVVPQSPPGAAAQAFVSLVFPAALTKAQLVECRVAAPSISYRLTGTGGQGSGTVTPPDEGPTPFIVPPNAGLLLWSSGSAPLIFFGCEITPVG